MLHSVRTKVALTFLAALVLALAIATFASYSYAHEREHEVTDEIGWTAVQSCAAMVEFMGETDGFHPDTAVYEENREVLRQLCKQMGVDFMYAFSTDVERGEITYIVCVAAADADDEKMRRERPYGTVVRAAISDQEKRALAGEDVHDALHLDNQFGNTLAWFHKVDELEGNVLAGAEYSISKQRKRVFDALLAVLIPTVLIMLGFLVVLLLVLRFNVFAPLRVIAERMKGFSPEDAGSLKPLEVGANDEMAQIARAFEGMASAIATYTGDIERMTAERVQADVELDVARRIQLGMVPRRLQLASSGFGAYAVSRAARQVGGDFYDVFELEGGRVGVIVGDVSGKGVAAALFMAMTKTMVRDGIWVMGSPARALNTVNAMLCDANPEGMFATVFACVFDPSSGEVVYANAGHMPPVVFGKGARVLDADPGVLLGLFKDVNLEESTFSLEVGEGLLIYTDGVTEAVDADKSFFGADALLACLGDAALRCDSGDAVESVVNAVDRFARGAEQFDDLTVACVVRRESDGSPGLACDIASFARMREDLLSARVDEGLARKACLGCEEAFANVVSHSGASRIWYWIGVHDDVLRVILSDDGAPFDPTTSGVPQRDFEDLDRGGMGISLIRQLATEMAWERVGNRNVLTMTFK